MKYFVLTLMLCVILAAASGRVQECSYNPKGCGKRAWESWKNMMEENAVKDREFKPNDEEVKKAMEFYENGLKEFPDRR